MSCNHSRINLLHTILSKPLTAILLMCLFVLMCAGQTRAAADERRLAILPLDTSNSMGMAYLAPSIEAMLKSRLTRPGMLKTMAAPDAKAKLAGVDTSSVDAICNKLGVDYALKGKITTAKGEPRIAIDVFAKGNAAPITSSTLSPRNLDEIIPKITELSANIIESVITHTPTKLAKDEVKEERPTLLAVAPDDDKQSMLRMNPAKLLQKNITNKEKDETLQALSKAGEGTSSKEERPAMAGASRTAIASPTAALASIKSNEAERPVLVSNTPAPAPNIVANASAPKQETWWNKLMPWQKDKENEPVVTIDADRGGLPYPTLNELMGRYRRPEPVQPILQTAASSPGTGANTASAPQKQTNAVKPQQSNAAQTASASPAFQTAASSGSASSVASPTQTNQSAGGAQQAASAQAAQQAQSDKKGLFSWLPNPFSSSKAEAQTSQAQQTKEVSNNKKTSTKGSTEDGPIWQWF
jgi:TolB-like protein